MLGMWAGACCHVALAAAGLSAVVAASAIAFATIKWIGVAYLIWLGVQSWRVKGGFLGATETARGGGFWPVFRQGVLVDLFNPKVAIFFLAFLPQFVVAGAGPVWMQLLIHGVLIVVVAAVIEPPLMLLGDRLTRKLRAQPRLTRWLDRGVGTMLIGLGVKLATTAR